ncbi:MAG: hypothetical protein ACK559_23560, partial [bacterium]
MVRVAVGALGERDVELSPHSVGVETVERAREHVLDLDGAPGVPGVREVRVGDPVLEEEVGVPRAVGAGELRAGRRRGEGVGGGRVGEDRAVEQPGERLLGDLPRAADAHVVLRGDGVEAPLEAGLHGGGEVLAP